MDISWLSGFAQSWQDRVRQGRLPHAVLLTGPPGVGKRAAASWMAARHLEIEAVATCPQFPVVAIEHADLRWISPPEDKHAIGIAQIRALVAEFSLTSYHGGGKVAVIEPANAMTTNAANSLLKTLEEPPGDALLILIADRKGRLPATIFSRCQRVELSSPSETEALAWLNRLRPGAGWSEALSLSGNAPLAALDSIERLDTHASMSRDFAAIGSGGGSALEVASRWTGLDTDFVLDWQARQVKIMVFKTSGAATKGPVAAIDESVLKRMDRRNLFCYLDIINRLRGQPAGSYNVQLTLEGLLIDLSEGLENCGQSPPAGELPELMVKR